jgi:hypothetical protein
VARHSCTKGEEPVRQGLSGWRLSFALIVCAGLQPRIHGREIQKSVMYQQTPKNGQYSSICQQFIPPSSCKVVEGEINPNGYCILFIKKAT